MRHSLHSILLAGCAAGVVGSLLEAIPGGSGCLTCAAYIGAGLLVAWHYANTYQVTIPAPAAGWMGAAAAALAALVSSLINFLIASLGGAPGYREQMQEGLRALEESGMSAAQIEQLRVWISTPAFLVTAVVFGLILTAAMGALGGVIGAGAFRKGEPPAETPMQ